MTTAKHRRLLGAAIVALLVVQGAVAFNATAQSVETTQVPVTSWVVRGTTAVDGLGSYLVPANVPTAAAGQATENRWSYTHVFGFVGNAAPFGTISLDTDGTERFASMQVNSGSGSPVVERLEYDWAANKAYFTLVTFLPGNVLAGFVYDVAANAWSFIGTVRVQAVWGRLSAQSVTGTVWYGAPQSSCEAYPYTDHFRFAPFGFVAGEANFRESIALANNVLEGDCTASVANEPNPTESWRHYRAGSQTGPTPSSSSTSSTSSSTSTSTSSTSSSTTSSTSTSTTSTLLPGVTLP